MGPYVVGSEPYLRTICWNALLAVSANLDANVLQSSVPHGLSAGQTIALPFGSAAGLASHDVYGRHQIYSVVNPTPSTLQLALAADGAPLPLTNLSAGVLAILADPTTLTLSVTLPDKSLATPAPNPAKEVTGAWGAFYEIVQVGPHIYKFTGTGVVIGSATGSFTANP